MKLSFTVYKVGREGEKKRREERGEVRGREGRGGEGRRRKEEQETGRQK